MSRYDWGQTHPGITGLESAVDEARAPVHCQAAAFAFGREDVAKWREAADTVNRALAARYALWDGILAAVKAG